ncbi:hypothetical protein A1O1_05310 [Capronia coronata CBS 617.96]|uniref:Yeast cell wall synthesis Kre9/Knh1-like N-terminal domain-containing protein n=1 Tax=Capronia coronata CBS 617.96 TaxID=1182541 RepID=W9YFF8_9EURO|nr:uncharacterized protein A1O1_05310 [Capronia coronata CBS 617.96]EXJ88380.1 hypothetical protein A1O1_05310 [Capronia coronata CBS 617.96]
MLTLGTLLLGLTFVACAVGQTKIAFTSVPAIAVAGESYNITWGGGDGSPVTVTLREGDPDDLKTVTTLADGVTDEFFLWDVSESLAAASDYALQITQGQDDINYSGLFSSTGGSSTPRNSSTSATTTTAAVVAGNSTSSATDVGTYASAGTGTALPRNTTFR